MPETPYEKAFYSSVYEGLPVSMPMSAVFEGVPSDFQNKASPSTWAVC